MLTTNHNCEWILFSIDCIGMLVLCSSNTNIPSCLRNCPQFLVMPLDLDNKNSVQENYTLLRESLPETLC